MGIFTGKDPNSEPSRNSPFCGYVAIVNVDLINFQKRKKKKKKAKQHTHLSQRHLTEWNLALLRVGGTVRTNSINSKG